jgi:Na+/proline symporter
MIKIAGVLMGLGKYPTVLICGTVTVIYSATAGLWGVVITDLLLFVVALAGSIAAAYYALQLPEVGGLSGLIGNPLVSDKLSLIPNLSDWTEISTILIIPLQFSGGARGIPGQSLGVAVTLPNVC